MFPLQHGNGKFEQFTGLGNMNKYFYSVLENMEFRVSKVKFVRQEECFHGISSTAKTVTTV